jgi:hypothetical protein
MRLTLPPSLVHFSGRLLIRARLATSVNKRIRVRPRLGAEQIGQPGDVRCDPPSLVACKQVGRASAGLLEIDVGERCAVVVTNNEGCLVDFFNVPRSRKAALLHFIRHSKVVASLIGRLPCAGCTIIRTSPAGP